MKTDAARPKRTSLAQRMASSSSLKRCTVTTGPKTSSWTISLPWSGPTMRWARTGAGAVGPLAAHDDLGAVAGAIDHAGHLVDVARRDERAHVEVVGLGRVAPADRADLVRERGDEAVVDGRAREDARGRGAVLPGVPVAPETDRSRRRVSTSASSNTMTGALPPSSRWSRLTASAAMWAMRLPVSVSPVTETIADGGVPDERVADGLAAAGDDVEDAGREDVGRDLGQRRGR